MENEFENKEIDKFNKLKDILKNNTKVIISIICALIIVVLSFFIFDYNQQKKNEIISEKFIKAGIALSSKDNKKSKKLYEEIVFSKNKFYSPLALNNIIENNLEKENEKVLDFFKIIENIKMDKDELDLIKLKKALYLKKHFQVADGNKLLKEIISENSIWKDAAVKLLD